jgi:hypothetical protein
MLVIQELHRFERGWGRMCGGVGSMAPLDIHQKPTEQAGKHCGGDPRERARTV